MIQFIKVFTGVLLLVASPLNAETWVSGALTLHEVSGEVALKKLGTEAVSLNAGQVPVSTHGLINCEAAYGSSAYFSTSNRTNLYFEGGGSFSIERFEQIMPDSEAWESGEFETGQSRMILNFRGGGIIIDSRNMLEASQCLIETPLGRLTVKRALWEMRIEFDPRSQIFDFTITCSDGRVRFTDLQGQQYTLRAGQRLAGAGSRTTPSIEVGERTDRSFEQMQRFRVIVEKHAKAASDLAQYLDHLQSIDQTTRRSAAVPSRRSTQSTRRPIVIEYADEPDPVTPFRGELKPPSAYQADLF